MLQYKISKYNLTYLNNQKFKMFISDVATFNVNMLNKSLDIYVIDYSSSFYSFD